MITMTNADYTPRFSVETALVHDYLKRELADPRNTLIIPRCQDSEAYPDRHSRMELVHHHQIPRPRGSVPVCCGCVACRRRDQSEHR